MRPPLLPPDRPSQTTNDPLSRRTWFFVRLLVVLFPVGLVLAWRRPDRTAKTKWVITAATALVVTVGACGSPPSADDSQHEALRPTPTLSDDPSPTPTPMPTPMPTVDPVPTHAATVNRVIDGDTIEVRSLAVRSGFGSSASTLPRAPQGSSRSAGRPAPTRRTSCRRGRRFNLELDVQRRDRYGRLLAYVWLSDPPIDNDDSQIRARSRPRHALQRGDCGRRRRVNPNLSPNPRSRNRATAVATATRPIPMCASRRRLRISTVGSSRIATSACEVMIRTASTGITTGGASRRR